ncbi:MAG TPA: hypothetical protein VHM88_08305 [Candidatus Acidoferrales bacterium]|nr:hypothetical protein [Candidatus Acidoferrales bacterium]
MKARIHSGFLLIGLTIESMREKGRRAHSAERGGGTNVKFVRSSSALAGGVLLGLLTTASAPITAPADLGQSFGAINFFIRSAEESADQSKVVFPLHRGTSHGQNVFYVLTEASDRGSANSLGINYAPKLNAAAGTAAVQKVTLNSDGSVNFPGTVMFGLGRVVVAGAGAATDPTTAFPPSAIHVPAAGDANYSPLIQMPDGTIFNAPQVANDSGQADKVLVLDKINMTVTYAGTEGRYDNRIVHYVSFDASLETPAALEDVTFAPNLNAAPSAGCADGAVAVSPCAREPLIAFTNGQTGPSNPQRQGLSSAIVDGLFPLNILKEIPSGKDDPGVPVYSPLWDIHLAMWVVPVDQRFRQTDFGAAFFLSVPNGPVASFGSRAQPLQASRFIVNCPAVSLNPTK